MSTWSYSAVSCEVNGTTSTTQLPRLYRSFVTITAGRVFLTSWPIVGSRLTSQMSPRRGVVGLGIPASTLGQFVPRLLIGRLPVSVQFSGLVAPLADGRCKLPGIDRL